MITTVIPAKLNEDKTKLELIDQTLLPNEEVFLYLDQREKILKRLRCYAFVALQQLEWPQHMDYMYA